jgi:hypothetical protein
MMRAALLALSISLLPTLARAQAIPLPGVRLVSEGCSPCRDGDRVRIVLEVWRPGVAITEAEVRAVVRPPHGAAVRLPLSGALIPLPAGGSSIAILDVEVADVPAGVYLVEGALLDPVTGVTFSRDVLPVVRQ